MYLEILISISVMADKIFMTQNYFGLRSFLYKQITPLDSAESTASRRTGKTQPRTAGTKRFRCRNTIRKKVFLLSFRGIDRCETMLISHGKDLSFVISVITSGRTDRNSLTKNNHVCDLTFQ